MSTRIVHHYPRQALDQMIVQLTATSLEIRCLVPGLHPTCWVRRNAVNFGYLTEYSRVSVKGWPTLLSHWAAYQAFVEEITDPEINLDHLCYTAPCWNPWHLDPVTPAVNNSRKPPEGDLHKYRHVDGRLL